MKRFAVALIFVSSAASMTFAARPAPTAAAATCPVTVLAPYGRYVATPRLHGPGLLLAGGNALQAPNGSLAWLHLRVVGSLTSRGGNVLIVRTSGRNEYDKPFYRIGAFASVRTIVVPPCATRAQVDALAPLVDKSDAVYFSGGTAAEYVTWKGGAFANAVERLYRRGGVVGGGSAGMEIQGEIVYDGVRAQRLHAETTSANAVKNPLERSIGFTTGLFAWPALAETIADSNFVARDRFGRDVVFVARILHNHHIVRVGTAYALGVDRSSAVAVDPDGTARVFNAKGGLGAYLIRADTFPYLQRNRPLRYTVRVTHIGKNGETFDLLRKQSPEPWYGVTVDGSQPNPYSRDPYRP